MIEEISFVNLMDGTLIKHDVDDPEMEEFWESNEWILEPIERGRRYQCLIQNNEIRFCSKLEERKTRIIEPKIQCIINELKNIKLTNGTLIDGYITSFDSKNTTRALELPVDKSLEFQKENKLFFIVNDIIYNNGETTYDLPLFERKEILIKSMCEDEHIKITNFFYDKKYEEYQKSKEKYDSFFFKNLDSEYVFKQSNRWRLLKKSQIYFAVILDIIPGQGKLENMCGALKIGQYKDNKLIEITNVSGLDNDERVMFFQDKDKYVGKVIEIRAFEKTESNYKEARFVQLREDKKPEECIF